MNKSKPLVSIGMPVYNGERYLAGAIDSLLAQDFDDFELIISDNASTDSTGQICEQYAARDRRIRYYRNDTNLGAAKNFHRVFELSSGKYFMWAAHDDLWEPTYINECVTALEQNPEAILCCTRLRFIDEEGEPVILGYDGDHNFDSVGLSARERVRILLSRTGWYTIYGLMRADILRKTNLTKNVWGVDVVLLLELCLIGAFVKIQKNLFLYRLQEKTVQSMMEGIDPANRNRPLLRSNTALLHELLRTVRTFKAGDFNRITMSFEVIASYVFRNRTMRRLIARENIDEFIRAYRQRDIKTACRVSIFCLLGMPETIGAMRKANETRLIGSYQQGKIGGVLRRLPLYIVLNPSNLFRLEAWASVGKFMRQTVRRLFAPTS